MSKLSESIENYQIKSVLSQTQNTQTLLALAPQSDEEVVIKALHFQSLDTWKIFDLFEREAKTLKRLSHPQIPRLLSFFREKSTDETVLYLVMEKMPGQSLAQKLATGWRPKESEAMAICRQILAILIYLHELFPPVIHRDLKPSNILLDDSGTVYLVDFGAVKDALRSKRSSTIVGTFGYIAPEQSMGKANTASDIYSLGAAMVHLLSGVPPAEMPYQNLTLQFASYLQCSERLKHWLNRALYPTLTGRFQSATEALQQLDMTSPVPHKKLRPTPKLKPLPGSTIQLSETLKETEINIPGGYMGNLDFLKILLMAGSAGFALFIYLIITHDAKIVDDEWIAVGIIYIAAVVFGGSLLSLLYALSTQVQMKISAVDFYIRRAAFGGLVSRSYRIPRGEIEEIQINRIQDETSPQFQQNRLLLYHRGIPIVLADSKIPRLEQEWLSKVIKQELQRSDNV